MSYFLRDSVDISNLTTDVYKLSENKALFKILEYPSYWILIIVWVSWDKLHVQLFVHCYLKFPVVSFPPRTVFVITRRQFGISQLVCHYFYSGPLIPNSFLSTNSFTLSLYNHISVFSLYDAHLLCVCFISILFHFYISMYFYWSSRFCPRSVFFLGFFPQAIFPDEVSDLRSKSNEPLNFYIVLKPSTGSCINEEVHAEICLHIKCSNEYPNR